MVFRSPTERLSSKIETHWINYSKIRHKGLCYLHCVYQKGKLESDLFVCSFVHLSWFTIIITAANTCAYDILIYGYITIKGHLVCHLGCKIEVFRFFQKLFFCNLQLPRFVKHEGCFAISMRKIFFPYFAITNVKWLRTLQVAKFFNK